MKRHISFLMSVILLSMVGTKIFAYDIKVENSDGVNICYNFINDGTELEVTGYYNGYYSGDVMIPEAVGYMDQSFIVTRIGNYAFAWSPSLTSVSIPNSVKTIGNYAFYQCSGLTALTIPNSVTDIGGCAFRDCTGLTSLIIPKSVTSIDQYVIQGCSGLSTITVENGNSRYDSRDNCNAIIDTENNSLVFGCNKSTIPNSVTSICMYAFMDCTGLTNLTIPNSVNTIEDYAFYGCSGLTTLTIPNSVTIIGGCSFYRCSGLTTLTIPNSVTSIGSSAFSGCSGLSSIIVESGNTRYDSRNDCNAIINTYSNSLEAGCNNTVIPNTVTSIGWGAFQDCTSLTNLTIPESVTSINGNAFYGCSSLMSLSIPSSVTYIGSNAFDYSGLYDKAPEGVFYVDKWVCGYKGTMPPNTSIELLEGTIGIASYAFSWCTDLISVTIPNTVNNIGHSAFNGCAGLITVNIPDGIKTIDSNTFYGCTSLLSIVIPEGVEYIHYEAFSGCSSLASVTIPNSVTYISEYAFYGCTGLNSIFVCKAMPFHLYDNVFDAGIFDRATLYVPTGRSVFFQEDNYWGRFSSIKEKDMPDVAVSESPFDNLYSKRLILSYTSRDSGGSFGWDPEGDFVQAVKFPAERMIRLKDNRITHIRFNMWHTEVSNLKVWIGTAQDKRDLLIQEVTDLHEGWTEVALEQPFTITGDPIFVGVDYNNNNFTLPVKWDAYAGNEEDACVCFRGGKWSSSEGTWLLQCLVEGDAVPKNDIQLLELVGPVYKRAIKVGEPYDCSLKLRNWGSMPVTQLDMLAQLNGEDVECSIFDYYDGIIVPRNPGIHEISLRVIPGEDISIGSKKLAIKPRQLNGEEYESSDALRELTMKIYEHDMGRQKVLIQNYTGTWCGYCPEFDEEIEQKQKERDDLVQISVHSRDTYYRSEAADSYMTMLYGDGIPNVDLNRCVWQTPYNYRSYIINYELDQAKAQPSFANVNISASYNKEDHTVDITVSGERNEDFVPVEEWTNLTVLLVEDKVLGYQTSSDLSPYYPHNGVIRTNVSAVWGDLVQWDGDKYEMHYSVGLDNLKNLGGAWNKDNMRIVAFLGKPFTGDNYDEIGIVDCDELYLKDISSGIQEVRIEKGASDVHDLNGRKVLSKSTSLESLPKGVYIIDGKKVVK